MTDSTKQLDGFLLRAGNRLGDAMQLEGARPAEAVQAAQESIELYAKAVYLLLQTAYPPRHSFTEDEFVAVIKTLPDEAALLNFPRLYLLHRFWASFYTTSKYGLEVLQTPANDLFRYSEAQLAISHAREWQNAVIRLRQVMAA